MGVKGVVSSTLVRSLERFAVRDDGTNDSETYAIRGLLLGTTCATPSDENVVSIWGALRDAGHRVNVLPHLPGGISPVGTLIVWVNGDDTHGDDEDAAAAALARERGESAISSVVLVYAHASKRMYLFDSAGTRLPLETVACLHASDFVTATESLLLRSSIAFQTESVEQLIKWRQELHNSDSTALFFQFPERKQSLFSARGVDVSSSHEPVSLSVNELVKIPEKRVLDANAATTTTATTSNKSKKNKAKAMYDAWEATSKTSSGSVSTSTTSGDFLSYTPDQETDNCGAGYVKSLEYGEIANVEVLQSLAFTTLPTHTAAAPSVEIPPMKSPYTVSCSVRVHVDALVVVSQSASVAEVIQVLRSELIKQLTRLEAQWTANVVQLQSHHFALVGVAFPLTMPAVNDKLSFSKPNDTLVADSLLQPPGRPLFDPSRCSLVAKARVLAQADVLFNVHEGIPPSGIANGTQYLVDGFYGYYHYMQQATNDKGWGCAYRSLQTLASWLFWNQYTSSSSPSSSSASPTLSHREIQQTLVKIGDKPASFLGSRDWIGSMEVGFVLDELFGVSFRTLNVSSGPELVSKAQELKHHFETQGTPVMMGGGQLAFTLLGIDYNASSGECAFLILDPHYVGAEDLVAIQTKTMALEGYKAVPCGWRKASTFAKNSFYNLCLPQRPLE